MRGTILIGRTISEQWSLVLSVYVITIDCDTEPGLADFCYTLLSFDYFLIHDDSSLFLLSYFLHIHTAVDGAQGYGGVHRGS